MCVSDGNGIASDGQSLLYFSMYLNEYVLLLYFFKKCNFLFGKEKLTSEYASIFDEILDRPDSQRVQSFHQIVLRKQSNHQLHLPLSCLPTSASLSLTQICSLIREQKRKGY